MKIINFTSRSDIIGATASAMCFIHCLVTPFLFVAYSNTAIIEDTHPWWWGILDIVFLVISFFAVYWSTYNTSKQFVKYIFWTLWMLLALIIINEKWEIAHIAEVFIYLTTLGLVFLHFYNRRYCQCEDDKCCVDAK
jgi:hypothetical protein|tara:strand:+ start:577 stop:987 length:411 start_codon:yes stop_codon:yes gene_type:complete